MSIDFIIHISFFLSLIIQLTSLGDFLILEKDQKKIQNGIELIALKLQYINPLEWYDLLIKKKTIKIGTNIIIFLSSFNSLLINIAKNQLTNINLIIASIILSILASILIFIYIFFFYKRKSLKMIEYIYSEGNFKRFLMRYLLYILYFLLLFLFILTLEIVYKSLIQAFSNYEIYISLGVLSILLFLLGRFILLYSLIIIGFIICIYKILILLLTLVIKIISFFVWKVAIYNNGVLAGITLLVTLFLGIIELYLKFYKIH